MNRNIVSICLFCALSFLAPLTVCGGTIPTVPVANPGNAGEVQFHGTFGAVAYDYRIGKYEVTNSQYAEFLNAKAASDPFSLYNVDMGSDDRGGITRSGSDGSYTFSVKANMGNKPVNFVSWYDAIRFANWLHNNQGAGDTETGAYTLLGSTPTPSNGLSITRNPGAHWFLPSEDEWYKAAYYDPTLSGGSGAYWHYPTQSNTIPAIATANSIGDISNPGVNVANYDRGADWNSLDGNVTTVGSAGSLSESYYGTSDQGGNVWEWNEDVVFGTFRGARGGSWGGVSGTLAASDHNGTDPTVEVHNVGLRVATVPEPSALALTLLGLFGLVAYRWLARR